MTVRTYGPAVLPVLPASASEVKVTYADGTTPTFATPVTVDPTTHAVSFAIDDQGNPPIKVVIRVQNAGGGSSTTVRATMPEPVPAPVTDPSGAITVETDPVASAAVTAEQSRAQTAEAGKASAAALTSETSRAQSAESAEATRAQAAEAANTTSIATHVSSGTAHASDSITFNDSGLIVVKGASVRAALAAVDAWTQAQPRHDAGPLANLPANGAWPNGSTYLATDQNFGTPYKMVAGAWVQGGAGVSQGSGKIIAGPVQMLGSGSFDLKAIGATVTDVTGMTLAVPANAGPVILRAKFEVQANTGTSVAGSQVRAILTITDDTNAVVADGQWTGQQVTAVAVVQGGQISLEKYLPAPVAAKTYKIRAQMSSAAPANWTSFLLFPSNGQGGANAEDSFYAQAV